jgi:hypothetical protein
LLNAHPYNPKPKADYRAVRGTSNRKITRQSASSLRTTLE